jgi:PAS domain S-box-containing protein
VASVLVRKAKDEQHERTNFLFKLIVERIRDGIIVEDEDNRIMLANRELCRLFDIKVSPEHVVGKKWYDIVDDIKDNLITPGEFTTRIKELTDKKKIVEGEVIKLKTGTIVERDYIPLYNRGKFIGHLRKYKDITPIKLNEEKALGDQSRLANILFALNTTAYSRIIESKDFTRGSVNSEDIGESSVNSFYTGPALMSDLIYEEDKIKVMDFLTEILKTGYGEIEYRTVAADGRIKWIHDRCKLIKNKEYLPISIDGVATDITDKKMMQIALEESEQRYRYVVNSIKEVLFQTGAEGKWTFINPAWEELTGYTVAESLGKHFWDIMHPEDIAYVVPDFREVTKAGEEFIRREVRYYTKSGELRWMEAMIRFKYDGNKQVLGTFGTWLDVTERKAFQGQLELRDKAISAVQNGIVITDPNQPDNPIIFCNPGFEKISGYKIEEVMGKNCRFMQGPDTDTVTVSEIRKAISERKHCSVILKNYRKDGTSFWNNLTISPIFNSQGNLINFVGIQSDISNRIEAEAALLESEIKFRSVVENVKEVIFQTDNNGLWTYLNKSWEEITGFTVEESLGQLFLNYVHPDDRERNQKLFEPLIQRKKEYCRHTVRYLTKGGGFRFIEVYARLTLDKNNNIIGTSGTLYDVTERLKAEDDIKLTLEKQKELNELKSRFISTVSHEFRTPLTSILASADLLQRYLDKWDNDKKTKTLNRIQDSVDHMNSMINDVLTLNKSESGAVVYNPVTTDIVKVCRTIFEEIKITASNKHIFVFETTHDEITGSFDEKLFRQLLQNLLSNAVKYSPDGGEIRVLIQFDDIEVTITVSDQGVGITPEDQEKLFSPFFRGANIGNIPGTGLGLSIFKKALEMQKGHLTFSSYLNKGTTFKFSIPYKA